MSGQSSFALSVPDGSEEKVVMLVDDEQEAREIADGMRRAGQQVAVRLYQPPWLASKRPDR